VRTLFLTLSLVTVSSIVGPPAAAGDRYLGRYQVTYYWIAREDDRYAGQLRDETLLDANGCELARVSRAFRRALDMEGTGELADGRIVNVAERTASGWRYVDLGVSGWGLGAGDVPLLPFRSVAADPERLPRGSRIHVPAFADLILPSGDQHGGRFVVDDVGSAIRARRLDVFIGDEQYLATIETTVRSHQRVPVYLIAPEPDDLLH